MALAGRKRVLSVLYHSGKIVRRGNQLCPTYDWSMYRRHTKITVCSAALAVTILGGEGYEEPRSLQGIEHSCTLLTGNMLSFSRCITGSGLHRRHVKLLGCG